MNISGTNNITAREWLQEQFTAADSDGSDTLSLDEVAASETGSKIDATQLISNFNEADTNGDGQLTREEQQQHMDAVEQRMQQLSNGGISFLDQDSNQSIDSLFDALSAEEGQEDNRQQLTDMANKLRSEGLTDQNLADSMDILNQAVPPISVTA